MDFIHVGNNARFQKRCHFWQFWLISGRNWFHDHRHRDRQRSIDVQFSNMTQPLRGFVALTIIKDDVFARCSLATWPLRSSALFAGWNAKSSKAIGEYPALCSAMIYSRVCPAKGHCRMKAPGWSHECRASASTTVEQNTFLPQAKLTKYPHWTFRCQLADQFLVSHQGQAPPVTNAFNCAEPASNPHGNAGNTTKPEQENWTTIPMKGR